MKNLEILKVWSNSEVRQKQERQNLKAQEMIEQLGKLQQEVLSLQTDLQLKTQENLGLSNLNSTYQTEIKSLKDLNKNLTDKCKKELNGLKSKLKESQDVNFALKIILVTLVVLLILTSIWIWKLKLDNQTLALDNKGMQEYIKQNLSGER